VAAKLGIADLLGDGPRPCGELADSTGMHASPWRAFREILLKWSARVREHYYRIGAGRSA
jgi:hypothetical protein